MTTLWRLHTSPYFPSHFKNLEEKLAQKLGLAYHEGQASQALLDDKSELIVITNTHCKLPDDLKQCENRIKLMIHANSGFDNLPYEWVKACPFPIILGNPIRAHGVSNMILSHLFHHFSPLHHQTQWDKSRTYKRKLLSELSILILGHGCIGKILEKSLAPLCSQLTIVDPLKNKEGSLTGHDVVIPVPSLSESSKGMINKSFLESQKSDVVLINCSRGAIVNFSELRDFLEQNQKASAYLDVFKKEPYDFSLVTLPNLFTTSHIAGVSENLYLNSLEFVEQVISKFINIKPDAFLKNYENLHLQQKSQQEFL